MDTAAAQAPLTTRQINIAAYALAFTAAVLTRDPSNEPLTDQEQQLAAAVPAPDVPVLQLRRLEDMLRRLSIADRQRPLRLTRDDEQLLRTALDFYASRLESSGADEGYTGPLETAPEVREVRSRLG